MKTKLPLAVLCFARLLVPCLSAQDLGPHFTKIKDGIYIETSKSATVSATNFAFSNCGIILTSEGVVLVDTCQTAMDSREVAEAVKKLTPLPVRFILDTETHEDHAFGHWLFSPPAIIINHHGAGEEMRQIYKNDQERQTPPAMVARMSEPGYRIVTPHIEYGDKMTLHLGERTFELLNLGTTHSLANTAVWLPSERVLFAASLALENQVSAIRPYTNIPDLLKMMKMMKALNPEVVIPGHGVPTTSKLFDDYSKYLELLLERVGKMMNDGKSLAQIQQELRMPEYESLIGFKERMPSNIDAAYRAIQGGYKP